MAQVADFWSYRGLVGNFAQRELKSKYKRSALGWLWSLINPAATLLTYTLVFGFFLRFNPPVAGNGELRNFAVYLFTALVVWNFFSAVVTGSMAALVGAGPLLKKIYFPPAAPVAGNALATLTQTGIETAILVVVFAALRNVGWTILLLPLLLALLAAFSLGVGLVLALLNVYFRDVGHLVAIGLNLLFYATPILYPVHLVPERSHGIPVRAIYDLNPLTQFVEAFRDVLYSLQVPSAARLLGLSAASLLTLAVGWLFFARRASDVSEQL